MSSKLYKVKTVHCKQHTTLKTTHKKHKNNFSKLKDNTTRCVHIHVEGIFEPAYINIIHYTTNISFLFNCRHRLRGIAVFFYCIKKKKRFDHHRFTGQFSYTCTHFFLICVHTYCPVHTQKRGRQKDCYIILILVLQKTYIYSALRLLLREDLRLEISDLRLAAASWRR